MSFLSLHGCWDKKCKNQHFEDHKRFSAVFIKLKYKWLQSRLPYLKKHQTLEILLKGLVNLQKIFFLKSYWFKSLLWEKQNSESPIKKSKLLPSYEDFKI